LVQHPGWLDYLDLIDDQGVALLGNMIQLDPSKPESFVKFLELKAKIDVLRDMTYLIERSIQMPEQVANIDKSYFNRLISTFKKLWRK